MPYSYKPLDPFALDTQPVIPKPDFRQPMSEFGKGARAFVDQTQALAGGLVGLGATAIEQVAPDIAKPMLDSAAQWGTDVYRGNMEEATAGQQAPKVADIEHIKSAGDLGNWAMYNLPQAVGSMATMLAGGGIGGAIAKAGVKQGIKALAKEGLRKAAAKEVQTAAEKTAIGTVNSALKKGFYTGAGLSSFGMESGGEFGQLTTGPEAVSPEKALAPSIGVGVANAVLEFIPEYAAAKYLGIGEAAKTGIASAIRNSPELSKKAVALAKQVGKAGATGAAIEGVTEGVQQLMQIAGERWAKDQDIYGRLSKDEWSQIRNATAMGALGGLAVGGALGPFHGVAAQEGEPQPGANTQPGATPLPTEQVNPNATAEQAAPQAGQEAPATAATPEVNVGPVTEDQTNALRMSEGQEAGAAEAATGAVPATTGTPTASGPAGSPAESEAQVAQRIANEANAIPTAVLAPHETYDSFAAEAQQLGYHPADLGITPENFNQLRNEELTNEQTPIGQRRAVQRAAEQASREGGQPSSSSSLNRPEEVRQEENVPAVGQGTKEEQVASFRTAKGSSYSVYGNGTTERTKAPHEGLEHQGDVGKKDRSVETWYVTPQVAAALNPTGLEAHWRLGIAPSGEMSLLVKRNDGQWGITPSQRALQAQKEPAVGLQPVEVWDKKTTNGVPTFSKVHFGNEITEVTPNASQIQSTEPANAAMQQPEGQTLNEPLPAVEGGQGVQSSNVEREGAAGTPRGFQEKITSYRVGPEGLFSGTHIENGSKVELPAFGADIAWFNDNSVNGTADGAPLADAVDSGQIEVPADLRTLLAGKEYADDTWTTDLIGAYALKKQGVSIAHFRNPRNPTQVVSVDLRKTTLKELRDKLEADLEPGNVAERKYKWESTKQEHEGAAGTGQAEVGRAWQPDEARQKLDSFVNKPGWAAKAEAAGVLKLNETSPEGAPSGSFDPKTGVMTINLDRISPEDNPLTIGAHEGTHAGVEEILGKSFDAFVKDIGKLAQKGSEAARLAQWNSLLAAADQTGDHKLRSQLTSGDLRGEISRVQAEIDKNPDLKWRQQQEQFAYFVQNAARDPKARGVLRRIINRVKLWWSKTGFGKALKAKGVGFELTDEMALDLARRAMVQAGQQTHSGAPLESFAGRNAETANHEALINAQQTTFRGDKTATDIWRETGWFQGKDGKWRFELDDSQAKLVGVPNKGVVAGHIGDFLDHSKLLKAYPNLKNVLVTISTGPQHEVRERGGYNRARKTISIEAKTPKRALNILLHELQHGIQHAEGFAAGASFKGILANAKFQQIQAETRVQGLQQRMIEGIKGGWLDTEAKQELRAQIAELKKAAAEDPRLAAVEAYRNVPGEAEAFDVQARQDLTEEGRKNILPQALESRVQVPTRTGDEATIYENPSVSQIKSLINRAGQIAERSGDYNEGVRMLRDPRDGTVYAWDAKADLLHKDVASAMGIDTSRYNIVPLSSQLVDPGQVEGTLLGLESRPQEPFPLFSRAQESAPALERTTSIIGQANEAESGIPYESRFTFTPPPWAFTDPTDENTILVNKPGFVNKLVYDYLDYFETIKKKIPGIYEKEMLKRSIVGAEKENAKRRYVEKARDLALKPIAGRVRSVTELGDMLVSRMEMEDNMNHKLAEGWSHVFVGELAKSLKNMTNVTDEVAREGKRIGDDLTKKRNRIVKGLNPETGEALRDVNGNEIEPSNVSDVQKKTMMYRLMEEASARLQSPQMNELIRIAVAKDLDTWAQYKDHAIGVARGESRWGAKDGRAIYNEVKDDPTFRALATIVDAVTALERDVRNEGGLLMDQEKEAMAAFAPHYVPTRREDYDVPGLFGGRRIGAGGKGVSTRAGTPEVMNPVHVLQNTLAKLDAAYEAAERNKISNATADLLYKDKQQENPSLWGKWFTIIEDESYVRRDKNGFFKEGKTSQAEPDDIVFIRNGKRLMIRPNKQNLRARYYTAAVNNLDSGPTGPLTKLLQLNNSIVRFVNVAGSPAFMLANAIKDPATAMFNLQKEDTQGLASKMFKNYPRTFRALKKTFFENLRDADPSTLQGQDLEDYELVKRWEKAGGRMSFTQSLRPMDTSWDSLEAQIKRRQTPGVGPAIQMGKAVLDKIESMNEMVENMVRLSTFDMSTRPRENGGLGLTDAQGARLAQEVTTNFLKRGFKSSAMSNWYLFFQASMNGNLRVVSNVLSSKRLQKVVAGTIATALLWDLAAAALQEDDDWDKGIRPDQKERNLYAPFTINGVRPSVPLPWVYNIVWRFGQMLGETLRGKRDVASLLVDTMGMTWNSINPLGNRATIAQNIAPTALLPFVQVWENKNFAGNPLGPEGYPGAGKKPNAYLSWNNTPEGYKWIAKTINDITGGTPAESGVLDLRPTTYQMLVNTLTGSLGTFFKQVGTTAGTLAQGELPEWKNAPVLRQLGTTPSSSVETGLYHENLSRVYGAHQSEKAYAAGPERDLIALQELRQKRGGELRMYKYARDVERQLASLRKQMKTAEIRGDERAVDVFKKRMEQTRQKFNVAYARRVGN